MGWTMKELSLEEKLEIVESMSGILAGLPEVTKKSIRRDRLDKYDLTENPVSAV